MTDTIATNALPRWSVSDVHESLEARSFVDAMEQTKTTAMVPTLRIEAVEASADTRTAARQNHGSEWMRP